MIKIPNMLMVGATQKKLGKTQVACALVKKFSAKYPIIAIKATLPYTDTESKYEILDEQNTSGTKDTAQLLAAGATRVFWLKASKPHLEETTLSLLDKIGRQAVLICESTSLRRVVEPGLFIMVADPDTRAWKPSAPEFAKLADRIILADAGDVVAHVSDVDFVAGRWMLANTCDVRTNNL